MPISAASQRWRFATFSAAFLLFWGLRLQTLHPAFHPDDSPETALAGAVLGIQHPPGYPLPTLLGRLACLFFPGPPAFQVSLLAAFFSSLAPLLLGALAWRLFPRNPGHSTLDRLCLASLILGAGCMPQLWFQGLSAKGSLYTLNLCLSLACLVCLHRAQESAKASAHSPDLNLAFLFAGLALAGHYMSFLLLAPALLGWAWSAIGGKPGWGKLVRSAVWALPGVALYLYLPLRAALDPILNWGDPRNLDRLWATLTRAQYSAGGEAHGLVNTWRLTQHFLSLLPEQLPWLALAMAILGIWKAWSGRLLRHPSQDLVPTSDRTLGRALVLALSLHLGLVLAYNNPPADSPWVINAFFLPDFALLWLFAAIGMHALLQSLSKLNGLATGIVLLAAAAATLPSRFSSSNYSNDYLAYDYSHDLVQALPRHSLLLASGGNDAFSIWYHRDILQRRRDVVLYDVPLTSAWYLDQLRRQAPDLGFEGASKDEITQRLLASPPATRPLYYSTHNPGDRGIPYALVSLVPAPGAALHLSVGAVSQPWSALRQRHLNDRVSPRDDNHDELLRYYPDSARALASFGTRVNVPALNQAGLALEKIWTPSLASVP